MAFSNEFYDYLEELPEKWELLPNDDIRIIKLHALAGVEVGKKISGYERKIKPIHIFKDGVLVMTAQRIGGSRGVRQQQAGFDIQMSAWRAQERQRIHVRICRKRWM